MSSRRQRRAERMQEWANADDDGIRWFAKAAWSIDKKKPTYYTGPLEYLVDFAKTWFPPEKRAAYDADLKSPGDDYTRDLEALKERILAERRAGLQSDVIELREKLAKPPVEPLNDAAREIRAHRKGKE